jgi:hypothetical protein
LGDGELARCKKLQQPASRRLRRDLQHVRHTSIR